METVMAKIQLQLMREGDTVVLYSPALDLAGYGKTAGAAKQDFDAALKVFMEETASHGTLEKALEELGWKKVWVENRAHWQPQIELLSGVIEEEIRLPA